MRVINIIAAAVFALFLAAPLLSLAVGGYSPLAENPYHWRGIDYAALTSSDSRYRTGLFKKVLTDSPAGMMAVRAKSTFDYDVVGYAETDQVISGLDGWLYYKTEFRGGDCLDPGSVEHGLDMVEALGAVASAAGIKFAFSVSPDKSVAQPEFLGPRARAASGCKIPSAENWRQLAANRGSHIVDHLAELRAAHLKPGTQLYLKTDTHWNELGQAIAVRGWSKRWLGIDPGMPRESDGKPFLIKTDLGATMLHLNQKEATTSFASFWQGRFHDAVGEGIRNAVVLHDSFYARAMPSLKVLFSDAQFFDLNHPHDAKMREAIAARPDYLLVNSVERSLFVRLRNAVYGWNGPLGLGLLDANEAAAQACDFEDGNAMPDPAQALVELPAAVSGQPCLRISLPETPGQVRVLLPSDAAPMYRSGLSIVREGGAKREWKLVLPAGYAGKTVIVRTGYGGDARLDIAVGSVHPPNG